MLKGYDISDTRNA